MRLARSCLLLLLTLVPLGVASAEEEALTPLDKYFRGKITSYKRGVITLHYDFADEAQAKDWYENLPFPIKRVEDQGVAWKDGALEVKGSTGVSHVAEFKGDIKVTSRIELHATSDIGGMITPNTDSHDFATFTIAEKYFHRWDGQRSPTGVNTVMKYGDQYRDSGASHDFVGFRYVARKPPRGPIIEGRSMDLAFGLKRGKLWMELGEDKLSGKDMGVRIRIARAGFYTIAGRFLVDHVTIEGKLSPEWLKTNGISPTLAVPLEDK